MFGKRSLTNELNDLLNTIWSESEHVSITQIRPRTIIMAHSHKRMSVENTVVAEVISIEAITAKHYWKRRQFCQSTDGSEKKIQWIMDPAMS